MFSIPYTGVFCSSEIAHLRRVLSMACELFGVALSDAAAVDLAAELLVIYQSGIHDEEEILSAAQRFSTQQPWVRLAVMSLEIEVERSPRLLEETRSFARLH